MFQALIHRFLLHRHFWRYANFDEIGELYASRMMRLMAVFMINIFVALYLYQEGYSLLFIAGFYAISFLFRAGVTYFSAQFVAKYGPKHGILAANLLYIPALVAFPFLATFGLPAIIIFGLFQSLSMVTFDLAYLVDFSKVKHVEHAGKELGYMQILERLTASLSPLIGGTIAFMIAPEATIWFSAVLFVLASIPLFRTKEQTRLNQELDFRHFPWKDTWRTIRAETAVGFDAVASNFVWVLFIAITIFGVSSGDDSIYFLVGAFASITILTSFFSAYAFGRIIDRRHGGDLLTISAVANALTHVFRAFVTTPAGIVAANVGNEVATTGYSMAFMRGVFDTADNAKGHRIVYLMFMSLAANLGGCIASLVFMLILLMNLPTVLTFQMFFVIAAVYVLLALTARFRLYR